MKPVAVYSDGISKEKQVFVSMDQKPFEIKCSLRNPNPVVRYGAEVYIDKGEQPKVRLIEVAQHGVSSNSSFDSDTSDLDQIFWFGPGEREYTIRGFYVNPESERKFVFAPTQQIHTGFDTAELRELNSQLGWIVIRFYQVDQFEYRTEKRCKGYSNLPRQTPVSVNTADPGSIKKAELFAVSIKPGELVKTGKCTPKQARLRNSVPPIFESKINYASMDTLWITQPSIFNSYGCWGGVPLSVLKRMDVRTRCIRAILGFKMRKLRASGVEEATSEDTMAILVQDQYETREPVAIRDVVATMDTLLSRAASYIICTGSEKDGNFGEGLVQAAPVRRQATRFQND